MGYPDRLTGQDREVLLAKRILRIAGLVFAGIIGLSLLFGSFYTIDQGEVGVQTRFGSIVSVANPGPHFKLPWVDSITKFSTRIETIEWHQTREGDSRMEGYSHDQQAAHMSVKLSYHVKSDEKSIVALYSRFHSPDSYANSIIIPRAPKLVKTVFGQFTAVSVIQDRKTFNLAAQNAVQDACSTVDNEAAPVIVDAVDVYDIKFSDAYEHAVEDRMKAEVEVLKVTQNLERERKTAEITVVQAKAEADSNLAKARASAEATRVKGEAEASAIRARSAALQSNPALIELTKAERWDGALPTTMVPGSSVPFMSVK